MTVEAGCDGAIVLQSVEEALDAVSQFVGEGAEHWRIDAIGFWPDVRIASLTCDLRTQRIAVVAAIGEQHALLAEQAQHFGGVGSVVRLPLAQLDLDGETVRIDERVDFGREPAAGTAHATATAAFFSPLAACW